jgi:hypothetical protein
VGVLVDIELQLTLGSWMKAPPLVAFGGS